MRQVDNFQIEIKKLDLMVEWARHKKTKKVLVLKKIVVPLRPEYK